MCKCNLADFFFFRQEEEKINKGNTKNRTKRKSYRKKWAISDSSPEVIQNENTWSD